MQLLILPGLICDATMFRRLQADFPQAQVVDDFYAGLSDFGAMAGHALRLVDGEGRFALLGHSMGARIALEIIRRCPQRVDRLALVDTGIHSVVQGEAEKRHALSAIGREEGFPALVDKWLPPMVAPENRLPELMEALRAMCLSAGQAVWEAHVAALLGRSSLDALLPQITCRANVIVGALDEWSPVSQHEQIATAIPQAELHVVEGAGHMLPAEKPEQFSQIVSAWMR